MKRFEQSCARLYAACSDPSGPVRRAHGGGCWLLEANLDQMSLRESIPFR